MDNAKPYDPARELAQIEFSHDGTSGRSVASADLLKCVQLACEQQPIWDIHTHLYPPSFGTPNLNFSSDPDSQGLMLFGIDELVTYHYLIAELFRYIPESRLSHEQFWKLTKREQADLIWKTLFVDHTPLSEACRGVVTTLEKLGLDPNERSLEAYRGFFAEQDPDLYIDHVMRLANVSTITMTNSVFDPNENRRWLSGAIQPDARFKSTLRIDPLVCDYASAARQLTEWGYPCSDFADSRTLDEVKRFINHWLDRTRTVYVALSLPPEFKFPADQIAGVNPPGQTILEKVILPICAHRNLPLALMIGARRRIMPSLRDAGDMVGVGHVDAVVNLCRLYPQNRFLVTMLARENQHELCVAARKFRNLMPFGCWWFVNVPSLIDEITMMRLELLGTSFIPQHSDARVLDQLIYKWDHSRRLIVGCLTEMYSRLSPARRVTKAQIESDVQALFAGNAERFIHS